MIIDIHKVAEDQSLVAYVCKNERLSRKPRHRRQNVIRGIGTHYGRPSNRGR